MTNIPGLSGCGGGAFNDGAEFCCGLFKRGPPLPDLHFFEKAKLLHKFLKM